TVIRHMPGVAAACGCRHRERGPWEGWWRPPVACPPMAIRWIDDHCHLGWERGDGTPDLAAVDATVADARSAGVERMITVGTDLARSEDAIAVARRHPGVVWATVGLHPHEAKQGLAGLG